MTDDPMPVARVERILPAPPPVVYREWLDPDALAEWMCPRPTRPTAIEVDPRKGGEFRYDIEENGTSFFVTGRYLVLDPPHRLTFTWHCSDWPDGTPESIVTVHLTPHGDDRTVMEIHHTLLPDDPTRHEQGWARVANQLAATLRSRL